MAIPAKRTNQAQTESEDTGTEVAVQGPGAGLPSFLQDTMAEHVGRGVSTKAEDQTIPMIYVLQDNSPQVKSRDPAYIEGAKPGDFFLKGPNVIIDGSQGFECIPCYFDRDTVEWVPRKKGGGYVGRHKAKPEDIPGSYQRPDPENPKRERWHNEAGNELVDTRYHYLLVDQMPFVLTFSSTGHTTSRNWMLLMNGARVGRDIAPSYAKRYKLTTVEKSNSSGSWFGIKVEAVGWVMDEDDFKAGASFYEQVSSGAVQAEAPMERDGGGEGGGGRGAPPAGKYEGDGDVPF